MVFRSSVLHILCRYTGQGCLSGSFAVRVWGSEPFEDMLLKVLCVILPA